MNIVRRRHAIRLIGVLVSFGKCFQNLNLNHILGGSTKVNAAGLNNDPGPSNANGVGCMISGVCRCEQGLSRYIGKLPIDIIINFLFQHIKIQLRVILGVSRYAHL